MHLITKWRNGAKSGQEFSFFSTFSSFARLDLFPTRHNGRRQQQVIQGLSRLQLTSFSASPGPQAIFLKGSAPA
jgi:hypothetical protein